MVEWRDGEAIVGVSGDRLRSIWPLIEGRGGRADSIESELLGRTAISFGKARRKSVLDQLSLLY